MTNCKAKWLKLWSNTTTTVARDNNSRDAKTTRNTARNEDKSVAETTAFWRKTSYLQSFDIQFLLCSNRMMFLNITSRQRMDGTKEASLRLTHGLHSRHYAHCRQHEAIDRQLSTLCSQITYYSTSLFTCPKPVILAIPKGLRLSPFGFSGRPCDGHVQIQGCLR
jgi:hypothetical protein